MSSVRAEELVHEKDTTREMPIIPSLMLATPGCWAWEEIGALLAGVFWGVLEVG
jgi:hypothetical protein